MFRTTVAPLSGFVDALTGDDGTPLLGDDDVPLVGLDQALHSLSVAAGFGMSLRVELEGLT